MLQRGPVDPFYQCLKLGDKDRFMHYYRKGYFREDALRLEAYNYLAFWNHWRLLSFLIDKYPIRELPQLTILVSMAIKGAAVEVIKGIYKRFKQIRTNEYAMIQIYNQIKLIRQLIRRNAKSNMNTDAAENYLEKSLMIKDWITPHPYSYVNHFLKMKV